MTLALIALTLLQVAIAVFGLVYLKRKLAWAVALAAGCTQYIITLAKLSGVIVLLIAMGTVPAFAADAIVFTSEAGQTLYVRVYTSSSAAVAQALTAGTSGNTRRYAVDNTAFTLPDGVYAYDIFVGTPSTVADDEWVTSGVLYWSEAAARKPLLENADLVFSENVLEEMAAYNNTAIEAGAVGTSVATLESKLPSDNAKIAGEGATAKNLDEVVAEGGGELPLSSNGLLNFQTFFNNADAVSSKTINNVTAPKNITITVPQP